MNERDPSEFSEEEIDEIVVAEADDESAWDEPIHVHPAHVAAIPLSGDLAARAAFLARMHQENSLKSWLQKIIRERIELEEGAFVEAKREFALKPDP